MKKEKAKKVKNINSCYYNLYDVGAVRIKTETNGLGWLKTLIVSLIIAAQLGFIIYLHLTFTVLFQGVLIASAILSLIACFFVLSSNKNSLSKAVWIIFLLVFFSFGYLIYILSDERLFFGGAKLRYNKVFSKFNYDEDFAHSRDDAKCSNEVKNTCEYLKNAGKFTSYNNTSLEYFNMGDLFFDDVLKKIENAKQFIFIEYFIISDGELLHRFASILEEKIKQGVEVRLIYDDMGCHKTLSRRTKVMLKNIGIKMYPFNRLVPLFSVGLNYRDHRKIVVVDGEFAYTGGCNLADEYINEKRMHGFWKDCGIRISGEGVDGFTGIFLRQWEFLSRKEEDYSVYLNKPCDIKSDSIVVPYADGLDYELPVGKSVYENIISNAKEKLYIMSPYFIVDDGFMDLLMTKALAGVDVRFILPEVPDKAMVYTVSRNNAEKLMDYGVKVYLMKNSFVHSKIMLTENSCVVGSINTDLRSFYQQFESAVYTDDKETMASINADFQRTIENSVIITDKNKSRRNIFVRMFVAILQIFAPLM